MKYDDVEAVSFHADGFTIGSHRGWRMATQIPGSQYFWEQAYWFDILGISNHSAYRKDQRRDGRLQKLAAFIGGGQEFHYGEHGGIRDVTLTSYLLLPWLLWRWHLRRSLDGPMASHGGTQIAAFLSYAAQGLGYLTRQLDSFTEMINGEQVTFTVGDNGASLDGFLELKQKSGGLMSQWLRWCAGGHELHELCKGPFEAIPNIFLFLFYAMGAPWRYTIWDVCLLRLWRWLLRCIAVGFERYVEIRGSVTDLGTVRQLVGRTRHLRRDPYTLAAWAKKAEALGGSTSQTWCALSGSKKYDWALSTAIAVESRRLNKEMMAPHKHFSVTWDPGSYSGVSYNLGMIAAVPGNCAVDLTPKAGDCPTIVFKY